MLQAIVIMTVATTNQSYRAILPSVPIENIHLSVQNKSTVADRACDVTAMFMTSLQ